MATSMRLLQPGTVVPVAGISFRQDVATTLTVGDPILLVHENTHAVDPLKRPGALAMEGWADLTAIHNAH